MGLGPTGFVKPLPVPDKTHTCGCGYRFCRVRVWVVQKNPRVARDNPYSYIIVRKNPICLFVKISYRLVPISRGQADFNLLHNNKLKLGSISEWQADLDIFL